MINIRKQSAERINRANLWYFNEGSVLDSSAIPEKKSGKRAELRTIYEDYDPFMSKTSERNNLKKECTFVVDWQLSDSL